MFFSNGLGIDISDNHIRVAKLSHDGKVRALKESVLPAGVVVDDQIEKPELFQSHLLEFFSSDPSFVDADVRVAVLVPDSRVFIGTFWLPARAKDAQREEEAIRRGQSVIPLPFKMASIDVEYGGVIEDRLATAVFAAPRETIKALSGISDALKSPIASIEMDAAAIHRLIVEARKAKVADESLMTVVDFGRNWINITLFDELHLPIFSRAIRVKSLREDEKETGDKLSATEIQRICDIVSETIQYFRGVEGSISIILAGKVGGVPEIVSICKERLATYSVASVSEVVSLPDVKPDDVQAYAQAIGAAMRAVRPRKYKQHHNFNQAILYEGSK